MAEYDEPKPTLIRVPVLTTPRLTLRAFEDAMWSPTPRCFRTQRSTSSSVTASR
jgi:hypothetical protein